jgi:hypothetical protein
VKEMILTGEAIKYAEGFEALDKEIRQEFPNYESLKLTEDEQINLFQITMMFERDEAFKRFMSACLCLYTQKVLEGEEAFSELINKIKEL